VKIARIWIFIFSLALVAGAVGYGANAADNRFLEIIHIDVGQGDATLVISPSGKTMLIDGGDTGRGNRVIMPLLKDRGIDSLDYIVATHYDADHIGGLDEVMNHFQGRIGQIFDRGRAGRKSTPGSKAYAQYIASGGLKRDRDPISLGSHGIILGEGITVWVVAVGGCVLGKGAKPIAANLDENSVSVAMVISYGQFDYFIGGDLTGGGKSGRRRTPDIETAVGLVAGDIDILKLSHHGSETSSNEIFLAATTPEIAVVSVGNGGKNGRYHHPKRSVLSRLHDLNKASGFRHLYATNQGETDGGLKRRDQSLLTIANGHVTVRTDGSHYEVNKDWYMTDDTRARIAESKNDARTICGRPGVGNSATAVPVLPNSASGHRYQTSSVLPGRKS
jgi:beta-lactamase superfamily II metal-dependent hydrolase